MQALVAKLPSPARDAGDAASRFRWNGENAEPIGVLASSQAEIQAVLLETKTRQQRLQQQAQAESAAVLGAPADTATQRAMARKLASMGSAERTAFAMQMEQRAQQAVQKPLQATGPDDAAAMQDAQEALAGALQDVTTATVQLASQVSRVQAIQAQSRTAHDAVGRDQQHAFDKIPLQQEGEGGGGCYSAANAQRAYAIQQQLDDRHVAAADDGLRQAAQWSQTTLAMMLAQARASDALVTKVDADLARMHGMFREQMAAQLEVSRFNPQQLETYWESVRSFDLAAAHWVRVRDRDRAQGWQAMACKKT